MAQQGLASLSKRRQYFLTTPLVQYPPSKSAQNIKRTSQCHKRGQIFPDKKLVYYREIFLSKGEQTKQANKQENSIIKCSVNE